MYTYIKQSFAGKYLTRDSELIEEGKIGTTWEDYLKGKILLLSEEQLRFRRENTRATVEEVWFMRTPQDSTSLDEAKLEKISAINEYDMSNSVNGFYFNGDFIWLDKETRAGLKLRFEAEAASGIKMTTLWYRSKEYTLPVQNAISMLLAIELYASKCYDNTQRHIANVNRLETVADVDNYCYTNGYPEMLKF